MVLRQTSQVVGVAPPGCKITSRREKIPEDVCYVVLLYLTLLCSKSSSSIVHTASQVTSVIAEITVLSFICIDQVRWIQLLRAIMQKNMVAKKGKEPVNEPYSAGQLLKKLKMGYSTAMPLKCFNF